MRLANLLILTLQGGVVIGAAFQADIRADSDRDGVVDLVGATDLKDKSTWTASRGAIFLPNIGDTDRRCSGRLSINSTNEELAACNDASDDIQRSPQYLAPLKTVPLPELSDSAKGTIDIPDLTVRPLVRIFRRQQNKWTYLKPNATFSCNDLRLGLDLGIDARDTRRPGGWDGRVTVRFRVVDDGQTSEDFVMLRVAPVLTHHHAQAAEQLVSIEPPLEPSFNEEISAAALAAGITAPLYTFPPYPKDGDPNDREDWAQDFFEPGYASMPGPNHTTISIRIMIRSAQDQRQNGRLLFTQIRNASIGAVQSLKGQYMTIDAMGNLETIPPYEHEEASYPAGRIVLGGDLQTNKTPDILPYLQAQEMQSPIILDTSWLVVGHIDEFIQFLPADNTRGWIIMIADPLLGIDILRNAHDMGHGSSTVFSRKNTTNANNVPGQTVDQLLQNEDLIANNTMWAETIEANLDILREETGINDEDIHRLPALWHDWESGLTMLPGNSTVSSSKVKKDVQSSHGSKHVGHLHKRDFNWPGTAVAYFPGMINGVVLNDRQVMVPKPWGPVVDGVDLLEQAARDVYGAVGYNITFINDWAYYSNGGEVHCGTNMLRYISEPWW